MIEPVIESLLQVALALELDKKKLESQANLCARLFALLLVLLNNFD